MSAEDWNAFVARQERLQRDMYGDPFYESGEWLALRYATLKRFGGVCHCCGCRPGRGNRIQVDHIKPRSRYPELELEPTNLQVLCRDCNLGKGAGDETDWRWL